MFDKKNIVITGGTGSFGKSFVGRILRQYKPSCIAVYSRDELKQFEMREKFSSEEYPIKYYIGDIRDKERLYRVCHDMDYVVHAAALKQVPTSESNPFEAVKTNVIGAENVIEAALENKVKKVIALSTDKASNPANLYGATKLVSDKLFAAANHWQSRGGTRFSVVRYGNVVGSRGSVIPFFMQRKKEGLLPITDPRMTRFWITLDQAVQFVMDNLKRMKGGELFIPKIPSMNIMDLATAIAPGVRTKIIGIRPGEKLHEMMISKDDAVNTLDFGQYFVIQPAQPWWDGQKFLDISGGVSVDDDFEYSSNTNDEWLTVKDLREMIKEL